MKNKILILILGLVITVSGYAQSPKVPCPSGYLGVENPYGSSCTGSNVCVMWYEPDNFEDPNCTGDGSTTTLCCQTSSGSGPICFDGTSTCGGLTVLTGDECHRYLFSLPSTCGSGKKEDNWTAYWDGYTWHVDPYPIGHQSQYTDNGNQFYDYQLGVAADGNLEIIVNGLMLTDNDGNVINW